LKDIFDFLLTNKEWIFSGIGVFILSGIILFLRHLASKKITVNKSNSEKVTSAETDNMKNSNLENPKINIKDQGVNISGNVKIGSGMFGGQKNIQYNDQSFDEFKLSISHPKLLSKRFSSSFIVKIYPSIQRNKVIMDYKQHVSDWEKNYNELRYDTNLMAGIKIRISLSSEDIQFSEEIIKDLKYEINSVSFTAKPKDSCSPGIHYVRLSLKDNETKQEYKSFTFQVKVVDFAFDHVSKPLLSNLLSIGLGVSSFITFILTFLGQIDKSLGLVSGASSGLIASFIYNRFLKQFKLVQS